MRQETARLLHEAAKAALTDLVCRFGYEHDICTTVSIIRRAVDHADKETPSDLAMPYKCIDCGGVNVEIESWVDCNTDELCGDVRDGGYCFCRDCQKHTRLAELEPAKAGE